MGRSSTEIVMRYEEEEERMVMPLLSLNHVSFLCKSVSRSVRFYEVVLGFVLIKRPSSFNFHGAWLFNYGIGIHLLECNSPDDIPEKKGFINPKDNHISFQCSDMKLVMSKLKEMNIKYVTATVEEGGVKVDQLFFHDPDGYMIEICNCDNLPVLPLSSSCPIKKKSPQPESRHPISFPSGKGRSCAGEVENQMMENLFTDMIDISF
ncbi:Glyoxalase-like domain [Macleaya cordata]|uniref:Glyoxalase-like domain n=1 Tax=Macleaya cordata TaxID=56857 RepID=A0A200QWY9_MACCD|nr:Glyoxalase-like domain [Macleaya cordata]